MTDCTPTGSLTDPELAPDACPSGHPYLCACGEPVTRRWDHTGLDSHWVDGFGTMLTTDAAGASYLSDPKGYLDGLFERSPAAYSALVARINLGMFPTRHMHRPVSCDHLPHDRVVDVPWCCDMPMQATRDGWRCRTAKVLTPYAAAVA